MKIQKKRKLKNKHYSENKCRCIAGHEMFGMGCKDDEHLICHNCGCSLFPHERQHKYCVNCQTNPYMPKNEPKDKLAEWNFISKEEFGIKEDKLNQIHNKKLGFTGIQYFDGNEELRSECSFIPFYIMGMSMIGTLLYWLFSSYGFLFLLNFIWIIPLSLMIGVIVNDRLN